MQLVVPTATAGLLYLVFCLVFRVKEINSLLRLLIRSKRTEG